MFQKFRIRLNKINKDLKTDIIDFENIISVDYENQDVYFKGRVSGELLIVSFKDCQFEYFTGLVDKNGKEIYENDSLLYKYPYDKRRHFKSKVYRSPIQASFVINGTNDKEQIELYKITANNYLEVI